MIKTILITGASGFIGSTITALLKSRFRILAPVRISALEKQTVKHMAGENVRVIPGEFYEDRVINQLSTENIDAILHFAAIRGETALPEETYQLVNVTGTEKLLTFARNRKIERFLYCSTVGVLGTIPENQPAKSDDTPHPDSLYHRSKWQAEELVHARGKSDFRISILRPTITYGRNDDGFIPKLISLVRLKYFIYPRQEVLIHLLSVSALSRLINRILEQDLFDGHRYLVADRAPVSLHLLVDHISRQLTGKPYLQVRRLPRGVFQMASRILGRFGQNGYRTSVQLISDNWTYDIIKTQQNLGYQPLDSLEEISRLHTFHPNGKIYVRN